MSTNLLWADAVAIERALRPALIEPKRGIPKKNHEDDPLGLYSASARELLLQAARVNYLPRFLPWVELDREVQAMFDGRPYLNPQEALLSSLAIWSGTENVINRARIALAMGAQFGIVRFEDEPTGPRWHLVHPGVVLLPRYGETFDVRTDQLVGRGTLEALIRTESRRRERYSLARRVRMTAEAIKILTRVAPETTTPSCLVAADYPPARNMGEFSENIAGFVDVMPLWRIGELIEVTYGMPKR